MGGVCCGPPAVSDQELLDGSGPGTLVTHEELWLQTSAEIPQTFITLRCPARPLSPPNPKNNTQKLILSRWFGVVWDRGVPPNPPPSTLPPWAPWPYRHCLSEDPSLTTCLFPGRVGMRGMRISRCVVIVVVDAPPLTTVAPFDCSSTL